jgi:hypothetical protein
VFDWICISLAVILALNSSYEFRAVSFVLLAEFIAVKLAFIAGIQITSYLEYTRIFLAYSIIQAISIVILFLLNSSVIPKLLIFINIGYNMLTISQFSINTIEFYDNYKYFAGTIMILELAYMFGGIKYVRAFRDSRRAYNPSIVSVTFRNSRRLFSRIQKGRAL